MHAVPQQTLIEEVAKDLAKHVQKPEWADYVKTGSHKERPPVRDDWWQVRAAAILRTVYLRGPIGVSKLRTKYGGLKNRGVKPSRFSRSGGNIIRTIFQQLEQAGLVKQAEKGVHKGRVTTPKGASLLNAAAKRLAPKHEKAVKPATAKKESEKKAAPAVPTAAQQE